jgi:hypothetical protein
MDGASQSISEGGSNFRGWYRPIDPLRPGFVGSSVNDFYTFNIFDEITPVAGRLAAMAVYVLGD